MIMDAFDCVYKARQLAPASLMPDIHAQLASLCTRLNHTSLALRHYESALALDANHVPSLVGLGILENRRDGGNLVLAYGYLTSALQVDATCHDAWYEMGLILEKQNKPSLAAEHFLTCVELERTAPIGSFRDIRRVF